MLDINFPTLNIIIISRKHLSGCYDAMLLQTGLPPPLLFFVHGRSPSFCLILLWLCTVIHIWKVNKELTSLQAYISVTHSSESRKDSRIHAATYRNLKVNK